ncbi:hypothetical protein [Gelidibacter salicanalis]|uniref:Uncharacterized protein n=1 Tax=Gelidibacter salicanalis TaxID=291193 RepID=A0A934KIV2_9FLAO|nr:hypothetical protein [Gelidibacter salicanalis]MBJ7880311.1 hypothetical protein [Gelidibacter salicanalis]
MIIFQDNVIKEFDDLIFDLYSKDYFSPKQSAEVYVDRIIDFIKESIETFPSQKTPQKLHHFGSKYMFYKSNSRTTWFIFYESEYQKYLITKIINNHIRDSNYLHGDK